MHLKYLLTAAVAASALTVGAAQAQVGAGADPNTGVTPNQSTPADATQSQTGTPSVDMTRPSGGSMAGRTNLPNGEVNTSTAGTGTSAGMTSSTAGASSSMSSGMGASSATTYGTPTGATVTTSTTTNGPVPDTAENRAKYGQPMSRAGKRTAAAGN